MIQAKPWAVFLGVTLALTSACGSKSNEKDGAAPAPNHGAVSSTTIAVATTATTSTTLPPWSFGDAAPSDTPTSDDLDGEGQPTANSDDIGQYGETFVDPNAVPEFVSEEAVPEVDPCTLVTLEDWAEWASVEITDAQLMPLEYGTACGFVTSRDEVRLALAVITPVGGIPWLSGLDSPTDIDVDGYPAHWLAGYPDAESSTLVVDLPSNDELIIELSTRAGLDPEAIKSAALNFASLALVRIGQS